MKIILNGANGRMGKEIIRCTEKNYRGSELAAGADLFGDGEYKHIYDIDIKGDCIIDFTSHLATQEVCDYAVRTNTPVVLSATGHTEEEVEIIKKASESVPVFFASNMSVGVALLVELAKFTAKAMPDADIEIVETHHNRKKDAPSGTALTLANAIKEVRENSRFVYGRNGNSPREADDIGIHAVRMGNIVGTHEVIIGTDTQTITLKHEAHDRALFAEGAICAAEFLVKQKPGLYSMQDMLEF